MAKLSEKKAEKIKWLKRQGFSTREIAKRLEIAPATAYYYAREIDPEKSKIHAEWRKKGLQILKKQLGKTEGIGMGVEKVEGVPFALVHLGFTVICPYCGSEEDHVYLCLECGRCLCVGSEDCVKEFDLKTAQRKEEVSLK